MLSCFCCRYFPLKATFSTIVSFVFHYVATNNDNNETEISVKRKKKNWIVLVIWC